MDLYFIRRSRKPYRLFSLLNKAKTNEEIRRQMRFFLSATKWEICPRAQNPALILAYLNGGSLR
jgi:hypothetical protein